MVSVSPLNAIGSLTSGLIGNAVNMETLALQPYWNIQNEQEASTLANQGITSHIQSRWL